MNIASIVALSAGFLLTGCASLDQHKSMMDGAMMSKEDCMAKMAKAASAPGDMPMKCDMMSGGHAKDAAVPAVDAHDHDASAGAAHPQ